MIRMRIDSTSLEPPERVLNQSRENVRPTRPRRAVPRQSADSLQCGTTEPIAERPHLAVDVLLWPERHFQFSSSQIVPHLLNLVRMFARKRLQPAWMRIDVMDPKRPVQFRE